MKNSKFKKINKVILILSFIIIFGTICFTISFITKKNEINNQFVIGNVNSEINEEFDKSNKIKSNVFIKNIGNIPIYVRVAIVINWQNKNGDILSDEPIKDLDYTIKFSNSENWILKGDGYYYFKKVVNEKEATDVLIEEIKQIKIYEDKIFDVDILSQVIQASPTKAAIESWNVNIVNDEIE